MLESKTQRFERLLQYRIFLADRIEKVEKALQNLNLIPKEKRDHFYAVDIPLLREKLNDEETVKALYEEIMKDKEEVWYEIYESINSQIERIDAIREKHMRIGPAKPVKVARHAIRIGEEQKETRLYADPRSDNSMAQQRALFSGPRRSSS